MTGADAGGADDSTTAGRRGQLVLVAAAVVALALVPMSAAYLQLGYHADVRAGDDAHAGPVARDTSRLLDRAVDNASVRVAGEYGWGDRDAAAAAVNRSLDAHLERIESRGVEAGVVVEVEQNGSAAAAWTARPDACPRGDDRRFGGCRTQGGVVLQERAGGTALVAAVFDVRVLSGRGTMDLTVVVTVAG